MFSEIYYNSGKGWNAYVDGAPANHFLGDFVLRAMRIPGGNHTIDFKFEPASYYSGERYSLFGSLLVLALIFGAFFLEFKKGSPKTVAN